MRVIYVLTNSTHDANRVNSWPLDFMRTGDYTSGSSGGYIGHRTTMGLYHSSASSDYPPSNRYTYSLLTGSGTVNPQEYDNLRGQGIAIRCVVRS